ncbi:MAG TPA: A/G-specific adenine glycosylase [Actinomycetota bacterium]|nr:A/G-specific adenine glycosylase [Actinomycetota bacterium]
MPPRTAVDRKAQARVLTWFDEHGRHLPWRETRDPYRTLVAEVMLQQTQTGRVAPSYEAFLGRFPTVERLAHAPAMDVILAWRGLGYNRRAIGLHRSAQAIARDHGGVFPREPGALRRLPGLGEYTSSAIACFAFDAQVPVVDTNVKRVLARAVAGKDASEVPSARLSRLAADWLPAGEAYRWNQALMDIGAMVCRISNPLCAKCPLRTTCAYRAKGRHRTAPVRAPKREERFDGSRRQKRGTIVDHLRRAARKGITVSELSKLMHPDGDGDPALLGEILAKLEKEGLAELTPAARKGSARGIVRLPSRAAKR